MNNIILRRPLATEHARLLTIVEGVVASVCETRRQHARLLHDALAHAFEMLGWRVFNEWQVANRGDDSVGYVDLVIVGDNGVSIAIEVDRSTPRDKSISTLGLVDALRVAVLRKRGRQLTDEAFYGIDAIMIAGVGRVHQQNSESGEADHDAMEVMPQLVISGRTLDVLTLIARGHTYDQILTLHPTFTYRDIFDAAHEVVVASRRA